MQTVSAVIYIQTNNKAITLTRNVVVLQNYKVINIFILLNSYILNTNLKCLFNYAKYVSS